MKYNWKSASLLLAVLVLASCGKTPVSSEEPSDSTNQEPSSSFLPSESASSEQVVDKTIHWEGVEATIVQLGDEFDLMAGVRAYDHTGDLVVEVIEDDYFTPHYVGSYQIIYEATPLEGNKVTVVRDLQVIKGVNVENGGFELSTAGWKFDTPGGAGTFKVVKGSGNNHYADIKVTSAGTEAWSVQLYQTGLRFEAGTTYEMSFEMSSEINRSVAAGFEDVGNNYAMLNPGYQAQIVPTEPGIYTSYYTASRDIGNVKAVIYLGQGLEIDATASKEHPLDIKIDNIRVRKIAIADPLKRPVFANAEAVSVIMKDQFDKLPAVTATDYKGNDISNKIVSFGAVPEFVNAQTRMVVSYRVEDDEGNFNFINRTVHYSIPRDNPYNMINADFDNGAQGWIFDVNQTNGTPKADFIDNKDGTISIDIQNQSNANWHIQLYQNGIALTKGKVYRTTIVMKSDGPQTVMFEVTNPSASNAQVITSPLSLTDQFQTFTIEYRATSSITAKLGLLLANSGVHLVTIDRFENEQIEASDATTIDMRDYLDYELINGDFKYGLYGFTGESSQGASVDYEADKLAQVIIVTVNGNAASPADWHAQLQQSNKVFEKDKTYKIEIVASSLANATAKIEITNNNGETTLIKENIAITDVEQTFTVEFTPTQNYNNGKFAILFGETIATTITLVSLKISNVTV